MKAGVVLLALFALAVAESADRDAPRQETGALRLELKTSVAEAPAGAFAPVEVWIVNDSAEAVSLVEPGDGSRYGWRTPLVQWLYGRPTDELGPRRLPPRCGNMNPLDAAGVFVLLPGERRRLGDWLGEPLPTETGAWRVRLRYRNDPEAAWRGEEVVSAAAIARVRQSTPVDLLSNELELQIVGEGSR
jgi:hypothetical protein